MTGLSGDTGFGNITIPRSEVPYGTTPTIFIDGQQAQNQGYTQDSFNFYVWSTTDFSTHKISIVFAFTSSGSEGKSNTLGIIYGAIAGIAVVAVVIAVLTLIIKRRKGRSSEND